MIRLFFVFVLSGFLISCANMSCIGSGTTQSPLGDRDLLLNRVKDLELLEKGRHTTHLSHVCNIIVANKKLAVIDLREQINGASSARGINRIIILDGNLELLNQIEYGNNRPLFCEENKLYIFGELYIEGFPEPGNIIQFDAFGNIQDLMQVDNNDWFTD